MRGMNQRQVAEILGFNGAATEVRMVHYEAEDRDPKDLLSIQNVLWKTSCRFPEDNYCIVR